MSVFSEVNWRPSRDETRAFGRLLMLGFLLIGIVLSALMRWQAGVWQAWPIWLCGGCALLGGFCWVVPAMGRPIYVLWHAVGGVLGFCITSLLLAAVFFLVITPVGLLLRMLGKDPLRRRWEKGARTYWQDAEKSVDARGYFRQF